MNKNRNDLKLNIIFNLILFTSIIVKSHFPTNHHNYSTAYLDPGTGTMIISAIIGVFATLVLGIKTFWYKIKSLFKPKKKS